MQDKRLMLQARAEDSGMKRGAKGMGKGYRPKGQGGNGQKAPHVVVL
jgi:hypothetical protein